MSRLSYASVIVIRRPAADVFDFCADLRNERDWNPDLRSVEKLTPGPMGVGARFHARWSNTPPTDVEVVEYDRPRSWATRSRALGMEITTRGRLREVADGTRYELRLELDAAGPARLLAPLALFSMRRREPHHMRRIKAALEASSESAGVRHANQGRT